MALWTFAYDHGYRNCDRAGSASTRWVGAVVQGPCGRRSWGEMVGLVSKGNHNYHIADLVVNYGISNTIVLEIPYVTTKTGISNRDAIVYN